MSLKKRAFLIAVLSALKTTAHDSMPTASTVIINNHSTSESNQQLIMLTNPFIHLLDGVTFMLDGVAIHQMLITLRKVMHMQSGQKEGTKTIGNYSFNNEKFSIKQLAEIEKIYPDNAQLLATLEFAKHDFIKTTEPFIKGIEPAKKLLLSLIDEFCERRHRLDSVILAWTHAQAGNEAKIFNHEIQDFATFNVFLSDLTLFLKDLINSCPKAREQYKEWYQKKNS